MGRHNRSEEAFFDFIPNKKFKIFLFNMKGVHGHPVNPLWIRPWWRRRCLLRHLRLLFVFAVVHSMLKQKQKARQS